MKNLTPQFYEDEGFEIVSGSSTYSSLNENEMAANDQITEQWTSRDELWSASIDSAHALYEWRKIDRRVLLLNVYV